MKKKHAKKKTLTGTQVKAAGNIEYAILNGRIRTDNFNSEEDLNEDFSNPNWFREEDELFSDPGI